MDNNQLVDEICRQNNVCLSKQNAEFPQLKHLKTSSNDFDVYNRTHIDQNLFKGFEYDNNRGSTKNLAHINQGVEGIPITTTLIDEENRKAKEKKMQRKESAHDKHKPGTPRHPSKGSSIH